MHRAFLHLTLLLNVFLITGSLFAFPVAYLSVYSGVQPDTLGENQRLYNGREWKDLYQHVENDQFFLSGAFMTGSVTMQGKTFHHIRLKYDVYKDEVLIPMEGGSLLQLNKELVDSFTIFHEDRNYRFVRLSGDSITNLNGYVRVICTGNAALYVRYIKKIDHPGVENKNDRFYQISRMYLVKDRLTYLITGKGDLLKALKDDRAQIKDFMRKNRIRLSKAEPESYIPLLAYYNSINP